MSEEEQNKRSVEVPEDTVAEFLGTKNLDQKQDTEEQAQESNLPVDGNTNPNLETPNNLNFSYFEKENVEVTEEDKKMFLKTLLNDTELQLPISMYNGNLNFVIRAKNSHANNMMLKVVDKRSLDEEINNLLIVNGWLQEYSMALMIEEVNGVTRETANIQVDDTVEQAQKKLDEIVAKYYQNLGFKWDIFLRAVHVFEIKRVKMQDECLNENFWMGIDLN